jgi:hypothetical protein
VLLSKILRIDVDHPATRKNYGVPSDNPFVNQAGAAPETWAWGLRNPWRFRFDRETGQLWEGDVGEDNWEEINLITKGGNYGWSIREGFHEFKPAKAGDAATYIDPVLKYAHNPYLAQSSPFSTHSTGACIIGGYGVSGEEISLNARDVYLWRLHCGNDLGNALREWEGDRKCQVAGAAKEYRRFRAGRRRGNLYAVGKRRAHLGNRAGGEGEGRDAVGMSLDDLR